ncbi:FG-GAP-like repeat-containing protein [Streptomyces sp. CAU 1734]|uniref:FG-GAP-like repeat-containing protein n=1 Tax=Streptomyces sp. CAU 1734 TaxID=3140360 RepID=UPI003260B33F
MTSFPSARSLGPAVAITVVGALTAPTAFAAPAAPAAPAKPASVQADDFNGDGYRDVVTGAPNATVRGARAAGRVAVLYGSKSGTLHARKQLLDQGLPGVPGEPVRHDRFGASITSSDLNRDGYADLVVGAPGDELPGEREDSDTGSLSVFWGTKGGLTRSAAVINGVRGSFEVADHLGYGDFDGDGNRDLVTGSAHQLRTLFGPFKRDGSPARVTTLTNPDTWYTESLAVGDHNGDGRSDIVATQSRVHPEDFDTVSALTVWNGTARGPVLAPVIDEVEAGHTIALGDVNGDGYGDIVTGTTEWGSDHGPFTRHKGGAITWIPGSAKGPVPARARAISQSSPGIPGTAETDDGFGTGVSVGRIDSDKYADIAFGVPGESIGGKESAGAVMILRGSAGGPASAGARLVNQDSAGVPGTLEKGDRFGGRTKLVDFNRDGRADLITGATGEDASRGAVWVLKGSAAGITAKGSHSFGPRTLGISEPRDLSFGADFNR